MPTYGWGANEPEIKPVAQGGDTIASYATKVKKAISDLFDTLNTFPWSTATQSEAGYMSADDKAALDGVPTTYLPLSGGTLTGTTNSPTPASTDNSTKIATTAFVNNRLPYEVGAWTPTIYGGTTEGSVLITRNGSFYQKFGNLIYLRLNADYKIVSSPTGAIRIGGLPYVSDYYYIGAMTANSNAGIALNLNTSSLLRPLSYNTSTGMHNVCSWGATASPTEWANGVNKTDTLLGQIWYRTSA